MTNQIDSFIAALDAGISCAYCRKICNESHPRLKHDAGCHNGPEATAQREAFRAVCVARAERGFCCSSRGGKLVCGNRLPSDVGPDDCWICLACQRDEEEYEGHCDGLAARREDHQRDE